MSEFLGVFSGVRFPHHIGDRITRDEVHHQKDNKRHTEQGWDQEQQATQEIFSHSVPVLGSVEESLIIVTRPQSQGATQMERRNAPQTLMVSILFESGSSLLESGWEVNAFAASLRVQSGCSGGLYSSPFLLACKHYSVINNKNVVYFRCATV